MIIFSLPVRSSHTNDNDTYGKDQRDPIVFGAATRPGEWIPAWSCAFPAPALPCRPVKSTGIEFAENSGEIGLVPTVNQL